MDIITLALAKKYTNTSLEKGMDWEKIHETPDTLEGYGITDGATKSEVNAIKDKIIGVYLFKGSIPTYEDLDTILDPEVGDVWNIAETGMNVAWTGEEWDTLGGSITDSLSDEDIEDACRVRIPPIYTDPVVTLKIFDDNNNLITENYLIDPGSTHTYKVRLEGQQNDAGAFYNGSVYYEQNDTKTQIISSTNDLPAEATVTITGGCQFIYGISWLEGPIKKDNFGDDYPQGHIQAGNIPADVSRSPEVIEYSKKFYIGVLDTTENVASTDLQNALYKDNNTGFEVGPFSPPEGTKRIFIATTLNVESVTMPSTFDVDITEQFERQEYSVDGYTIYVYAPGSITPEQTFLIRLEG